MPDSYGWQPVYVVWGDEHVFYRYLKENDELVSYIKDELIKRPTIALNTSLVTEDNLTGFTTQ